MTEQPQPLRETPLAHQCVCLILHQTVAGEMRDKCFANVEDPDSPFCPDCEQAGHPELHEQAAGKVMRS